MKGYKSSKSNRVSGKAIYFPRNKYAMFARGGSRATRFFGDASHQNIVCPRQKNGTKKRQGISTTIRKNMLFKSANCDVKRFRMSDWAPIYVPSRMQFPLRENFSP